VQQVKAVFGDDTVEPEVVRVDTWTINETFADVIVRGACKSTCWCGIVSLGIGPIGCLFSLFL
jgi:hypothetical protein